MPRKNSRNTKGSRVFYIVTENATDHAAFFEAIKKYIGKLNNSNDINNVRKSFAETTQVAPKIAVSNIA